MKNPILRIVVSAVLFSLAAGIIVFVIGLILKWKTYAQFSDAYFWAGAVMISIAVVFSLGRIGGGSASAGGYSESFAHVDPDERNRLWAADLNRGYNALAFFGIAGLLLFGMSGLAILIGRMG